jgi:hypothetical protein
MHHLRFSSLVPSLGQGNQAFGLTSDGMCLGLGCADSFMREQLVD